MPAIVVVAVMAVFALGYRYYSRYLAERVYGLDPAYVPPAHRFRDGVDFVPTNKHVLFGITIFQSPVRRRSSARDRGLLGLGPALAWIVLGTIFAAGVHDFGAVVVSFAATTMDTGFGSSATSCRRSQTCCGGGGSPAT